MDSIGRRSRLDWSDDRVLAHVRALAESTPAGFDPNCAICQVAVERGLLEVD